MNNLQKSLIASLKTNACNISDAIKKNNCSLEEFYSFMKVEDFKSGFDEAKQLADDFARTQFMKLIQKGDRQAVIEYQKMLRQTDDANEYKKIRKTVMSILIRYSETKTAVLREFCSCFSCSKNTAEDYFKAVLVEYSLKTPAQRKKDEVANSNTRMAQRFKDGKLSEIDMYKSMMLIALNDSENSEYPSERKGAMDKVIDIQRRLDEIQERKRRDNEQDDVKLTDGFDSLASGMKPEEIAEYRDTLTREMMAIENANS
jgi:hypothetical protein